MGGDRREFVDGKNIATVGNVIETQKFIKSVTKNCDISPVLFILLQCKTHTKTLFQQYRKQKLGAVKELRQGSPAPQGMESTCAREYLPFITSAGAVPPPPHTHTPTPSPLPGHFGDSTLCLWLLGIRDCVLLQAPSCSHLLLSYTLWPVFLNPIGRCFLPIISGIRKKQDSESQKTGRNTTTVSLC